MLFKPLKVDLIKFTDNFLNSKKAWLESLVKERLRDTGKDYEDKKLKTFSAIEQKLGEVYSTFTIREKRAKGQRTDIVTLEDTGDFYKTFKAKSKNAILNVSANFQKGNEDISDNLDTSKVLGWNDDDIDLIVKILFKEIIKEINENIQLF